MRFERIKVTDDAVELDWSQTNAKGTIETTALKSKERPLPSLPNAVNAFRDFCNNLLDFPESYEDGLRVTTIHLSTNPKTGARGLVCTCRKELDNHPSPFHFNTPLVLEAIEDEQEGQPGFYADAVQKLVTKVEQAAEAFVRNQREQGDMFAVRETTAAATDEASADTEGNEAVIAIEGGAKKRRRRAGKKVTPETELAATEQMSGKDLAAGERQEDEPYIIAAAPAGLNATDD